MKLISFSAENFLSYKQINFTFSKGLTLVAGSTGTGKSSLFDIPTWILFGVTAKKLDTKQTIKWNESGTIGTLTALINDALVTIVRKRTKTSQDLYYIHKNQEVRGTNIKDTQLKLENLLKISKDQFIDGSYYSDLSFSNVFYNAPAALRHDFFEKLCDFSFINNLKHKLDIKDAELFKEIQIVDNILSSTAKTIEWISQTILRLTDNESKWLDKQKDYDNEIFEQELQFDTKLKQYKERLFESIQQYKAHITLIRLRLSEQVDVCTVCGSKNEDYNKNVRDLVRIESNLQHALQNLDQLQEKKFIRPLKNIETESPFKADITKLQQDHGIQTLSLTHNEQKKQVLNKQVLSTTLLKTAIRTLKKNQLYSVIKYLESETNDLLSTYFEAQFSIKLTPELNDWIEVEILNQANICSYGQLSKGQKQILKLCTAIAIMKLYKMNNMESINTLFFDEAFDGMDTNTKLLATTMLNSLTNQYDNIYLIDHLPDLQVMIDKKITVTRINESSELSYE